MDIVCCTDTNFVIPLGVMIHSLCVNNERQELHFHVIIDDSVSEHQKEELRTVIPGDGTVNFYLIDVENIRQYLVVKVENFPVPIYYRLLMAKILPESVHKVLYLDADIIVRHDLAELWNISLENLAVAGVPNASYSNHCERLAYSEELGYFNSGVLLFNLDYIREHGLTDDFISYIMNNPEKLLMPDQDVLNYVLKDCKMMLPVQFNAQEEFYRIPPVVEYVNDKYIQDGIENPLIVHFTGIKPWNKKCQHPLKNLYYYYRSNTVWDGNTFMETFCYHKVKQPIVLRIKIGISRLMYIFSTFKNNRNERTVAYKDICLKK